MLGVAIATLQAWRRLGKPPAFIRLGHAVRLSAVRPAPTDPAGRLRQPARGRRACLLGVRVERIPVLVRGQFEVPDPPGSPPSMQRCPTASQGVGAPSNSDHAPAADSHGSPARKSDRAYALIEIDADAAQLHRRRDRQRVPLQAIGGIARAQRTGTHRR